MNSSEESIRAAGFSYDARVIIPSGQVLSFRETSKNAGYIHITILYINNIDLTRIIRT